MAICRLFSWALVCFTALVFSAKGETLFLSSLNWPPYTGEQLKDGGASAAVVSAALKAKGHDLHVDYYPWSRTIRMVSREDAIYSGYFPEYYYPTDQYVFSASIGSSPLGLLERRLYPIKWSRIKDLNQYTLGVVRDYVNTIELDEMITSGVQHVEVVSSDEHNIRKVATGRVHGAVIDKYVYNYYIHQPHLVELKNKLDMNKQLLASKQLYIAFKNTPEGHRWREVFNDGLALIDPEQIVEEYLASMK
ncbi:transporter substrate-binding domain-containing protein [Shewanella mesophila]|uniref:substrate-binding periplasmic protein n=1 Tax=Shewanella mesophila TaxID=2864208 RepID=UPI001C6588AC|nr:transporter substrate-binding domain-containing protein [Shewanella mesophila]QYJ88025.1 transporter substrate-binding domain-containing protein [Shewanella mesophila]